MSNQILFIIMGGSVGILVLITIIYLIMRKKMEKSEYRQLQKLRQGTRAEKFSMEILYQKLYKT